MLEAGVRTSMKLPETMSFLGDSAFERCSSLERINLPSNAARFFILFLHSKGHFGAQVTHIGRSCFAHCTALKKLVLPSSVTYIGDNAFLGCSALRQLVIPDSVTRIERAWEW